MRPSEKPVFSTMRYKATCCLLMCLLVRALIPLGYMPGNVFAGEYMMLCPEGLPPTAITMEHHAHHQSDDAVATADQTCPIGAALQQATITAPDLPPVSPLNAHGLQIRDAFDVSDAPFFRFYLSRAPPQNRYQPA